MAQYLTVLAAAQYLGVSREKLSRLIKTGKLNPVNNELDGRERLIPLSQLDALKIPGQKISGSVKQVQGKVTSTARNQLKNVLWLITNLNRKEDKNMSTAIPAEVELKCSFCGKAAHEVSRLQQFAKQMSW